MNLIANKEQEKEKKNKKIKHAHLYQTTKKIIEANRTYMYKF